MNGRWVFKWTNVLNRSRWGCKEEILILIKPQGSLDRNMTLIISVLTFDRVFQVSDRRLTLDGSIYSDSTNEPDQSNKSIVVQTQDSVFSIAYTGMAKFGPNSEDTDIWLADYLASMNPFNKPIQDIVEPLHEEIINTAPLTPGYSSPTLSVVLAGYTWDFSDPEDVKYEPFILSLNFPASYNDIMFGENEERDVAYRAVYAGEYRAVDGTIRKRIRRLADQAFFHNNSNIKIVSRLAALVRAAASDEKYGHKIGANCMSVAVHKNGSFEARYHPEDASTKIYFPHYITETGLVKRGQGQLDSTSGKISFTWRPSEYFDNH